MLYNQVMKFLRKLLCLITILCLCACSSSNSVVKTYHTYTCYPIGYLLNRIGGDRISTTSIQNGSDIQNATIVENYQDIIDNSIAFYYINGLEPYMDLYSDAILDSSASKIDLSSSSIYSFKRYTPVNVNGSVTYVENPYYDGDIFDEIDTYSNDLFLWLNPIGMLSMAKQIYNYLSSNYSEQAAYFKENYESLENDLISLDASYQNLATSLVKNNQHIKFVSMTPSFGSWQKAYGIEVYPVCLSKYGALPTDSELEIIKERIVADGVEYIAYEPNMSEDMLELFSRLEKELNLKRVNLSNISSLTVTQKTDNKDYLTLMYENLAVLESIASSSSDTNTESSAS